MIRVRGTIGVRRTIKETLSRLNIKRVNNLALIYGTKPNIGMLNKCQDFVTFGPVDEKTLHMLLEKNNVKVSKEDVSAVLAGKKTARQVTKIPVTMHPPRHGYEGIKRNYSSGGALGYRGEEINSLIRRMSPT